MMVFFLSFIPIDKFEVLLLSFPLPFPLPLVLLAD